MLLIVPQTITSDTRQYNSSSFLNDLGIYIICHDSSNDTYNVSVNTDLFSVNTKGKCTTVKLIKDKSKGFRFYSRCADLPNTNYMSSL